VVPDSLERLVQREVQACREGQVWLGCQVWLDQLVKVDYLGQSDLWVQKAVQDSEDRSEILADLVLREQPVILVLAVPEEVQE